MDTLRAELETTRGEDGQMPSYYRQLDRLVLQPGFNTTIDPELGDLPWRAFKAQADRFPSPAFIFALARPPDEANASAAVYVVEGAGSVAVNGRYMYAGFDTGHEYELKVDGRRFLLFRVGGACWARALRVSNT